MPTRNPYEEGAQKAAFSDGPTPWPGPHVGLERGSPIAERPWPATKFNKAVTKCVGAGSSDRKNARLAGMARERGWSRVQIPAGPPVCRSATSMGFLSVGPPRGHMAMENGVTVVPLYGPVSVALFPPSSPSPCLTGACRPRPAPTIFITP